MMNTIKTEENQKKIRQYERKIEIKKIIEKGIKQNMFLAISRIKHINDYQYRQIKRKFPGNQLNIEHTKQFLNNKQTRLKKIFFLHISQL